MGRDRVVVGDPGRRLVEQRGGVSPIGAAHVIAFERVHKGFGHPVRLRARLRCRNRFEGEPLRGADRVERGVDRAVVAQGLEAMRATAYAAREARRIADGNAGPPSQAWIRAASHATGRGLDGVAYIADQRRSLTRSLGLDDCGRRRADGVREIVEQMCRPIRRRRVVGEIFPRPDELRRDGHAAGHPDFSGFGAVRVQLDVWPFDPPRARIILNRLDVDRIDGRFRCHELRDSLVGGGLPCHDRSLAARRERSTVSGTLQSRSPSVINTERGNPVISDVECLSAPRYDAGCLSNGSQETSLSNPAAPDDAGRPFLTVVICTHNRARRLDETLRSLTLASSPLHHQLEILVVANACTDDTERVVQEYASRLPLRLVVEPEPGLSHARNAGVRTARGDYIIWTDDDVRVHVDWLTAYERAILKWPGTTVFGGTIIPIFEGGPPSWLARAVHLCESAFASRRPSAHASIDPTRDGLPYGANFAIARPAQRARPYDVRLGRQRSRWLTGGEETAVIEAVLDAGGTARWVPDAIVEHMIGAERQTTAYLRRYFEGQGYVAGLEERRARTGSPRAVRDAASVLRHELAFRFVRATRPSTEWVPALLHAATVRGRYHARRTV